MFMMSRHFLGPYPLDHHSTASNRAQAHPKKRNGFLEKVGAGGVAGAAACECVYYVSRPYTGFKCSIISHFLDSIHVWTKIACNTCTGGADSEAVKPETTVEAAEAGWIFEWVGRQTDSRTRSC